MSGVGPPHRLFIYAHNACPRTPTPTLANDDEKAAQIQSLNTRLYGRTDARPHASPRSRRGLPADAPPRRRAQAPQADDLVGVYVVLLPRHVVL